MCACACVGGAEGSREEVIFGQERDMEFEEESILAIEGGESWTQDGPFKIGMCFGEALAWRVTTGIRKLPPPSTLVARPSVIAHLSCTVVAHWSAVSSPQGCAP